MRARTVWLAFLAITVSIGTSYLIASLDVSVAAPLEQVRDLIAEREYQKAIELAGQRLSAEELEAQEREDLRFLLGHAQVLSGSLEDARKTFEKLQSDFPE